MGQVTAVSQAHTQHRVAGLQKGYVYSGVGLRAAVGLHVGILGAEQLAGTVDGDVLHHVHALATAVIAAGRIALGVLVGQNGAGGQQHRLTDHVFRGDQLDTPTLALILRLDSGTDLGIKGGQGGDGVFNHNYLSCFVFLWQFAKTCRLLYHTALRFVN